MNRRGFFNGLARAAAIVALAPQLAFRAKPVTLGAFWFETGGPIVMTTDATYRAWFEKMAKDNVYLKDLFPLPPRDNRWDRPSPTWDF